MPPPLLAALAVAIPIALFGAFLRARYLARLPAHERRIRGEQARFDGLIAAPSVDSAASPARARAAPTWGP